MNAKHPLGSLIEAVQRAKGWSDRDLEVRSRGLSGVGKSNISKIKNHPLNSFKGQTLKNLASLLQVPERLVLSAALSSLDVELDLDREVGLLDVVSADARLSDDDKAFLRSLILRMYEHPGSSGGEDGNSNLNSDSRRSSGSVQTQLETKRMALSASDVKQQLQKRNLEEYGEGLS